MNNCSFSRAELVLAFGAVLIWVIIKCSLRGKGQPQINIILKKEASEAFLVLRSLCSPPTPFKKYNCFTFWFSTHNWLKPNEMTSVSKWLTLLEIRHTGAARGLRNRASVLFPEKKVWKFDSESLRKGGFEHFSLQCPAQPTSFQIRGGSCLCPTVAPPRQICHADGWVTFIPPFLQHQVCFR